MYENVFTGVAASVGLQPVLQYGDQQLDGMLEQVRWGRRPVTVLWHSVLHFTLGHSASEKRAVRLWLVY